MRNPELISNKVIELPALMQQAARLRFFGKTIAFTNGCFDILHKGHLASIFAAAKEADFLVIGLNSDNSVKKLKGEGRPVNGQNERAQMLAALQAVDAVVIFNEDTPRQLIATLLPDVLVKGGDYSVEEIAGSSEVIASGGRVVIYPIVEGFSTTGIINRIRKT